MGGAKKRIGHAVVSSNDGNACTGICQSALADIRAKCLDCCGGSRRMVERYKDKTCALWKWTHQGKGEVTHEHEGIQGF